jgi:hypothetical protein
VLLLKRMRGTPSSICNNRIRLTGRAARGAVVALVVAATGALPAIAEKPQCALLQGVMKEVSAVRALTPKGEVPCAIASREEIGEFLRQSVSKKLPPKKLEMEQVVYRAVGIVPDEYDYVHGVIEFYLSQIGGYYDPYTKRFVMADWIPASIQESVARHELTHALQDQSYGLDRFLDPTGDNGDQLMALASLVEGDATAVMNDIDRMQRGQPPLAKIKSIDTGEEDKVLALTTAALPTQTPQALEAMILFPYVHGIKFVHAILRSGGYAAVDAAFKEPPRSSHEILQPGDYLSRRFKAENPTAEGLASAAPGAAPLYSDVLGEFAVRAILEGAEISKTQASKASGGWKGDRAVLFVAPDGSRSVVWKSVWQSEVDAQEFASAYRAMIRSRYGVALGEQRTQISPSKAAALVAHGREVLAQFWIPRDPAA